MLAGLSGVDTGNGWMGFTSADANLNSVASYMSEMVLADVVVDGAYFRIIGFDYFAYDANMAAVLVNSVQEGCHTVSVDVDIKPGSCPNPFNLKSRGVLPVAILGTQTFDVATIDAASIHLEGVPAIRSNYEDVTRPVMDGLPCECTTAGPDGYMDLTLKFSRPPLALKLWLDQGPLVQDQVLSLELTGNLLDGTPISGSDCVVIRGNIPDGLIASQADINSDGIVDFADLGLLKQHFWKSTIPAD
jgi:hypothetical protein